MEERVDDSHGGNAISPLNKDSRMSGSGQCLNDPVPRDSIDANYSKPCHASESRSLDSNGYTVSGSSHVITDYCLSHNGSSNDSVTSQSFPAISKDVFPSTDTGIDSSVNSFDESDSSCGQVLNDLVGTKCFGNNLENKLCYEACGSSVDDSVSNVAVVTAPVASEDSKETPEMENDSECESLKAEANNYGSGVDPDGATCDNKCVAIVDLNLTDIDNCVVESSTLSLCSEFKSRSTCPNDQTTGSDIVKCGNNIEDGNIRIEKTQNTDTSIIIVDLVGKPPNSVNLEQIDAKTEMYVIHSSEGSSLQRDPHQNQKQSINVTDNKTANENESKSSPPFNILDAYQGQSTSSTGLAYPNTEVSPTTHSSEKAQSELDFDDRSHDKRCDGSTSDDISQSSSKMTCSPHDSASSSTSLKPTSSSSGTTRPPCPSSPHLSRKYSVTEETSKPKQLQPVISAAYKKPASFEEPPFPVIKNVAVSRGHRKDKVSKLGGCFQRFGSFGRRKKRKFSPPEEGVEEDSTSVGPFGGDDEENHTTIGLSENSRDQPDARHEIIVGKIPKVCEDDIFADVQKANCENEALNIVKPSVCNELEDETKYITINSSSLNSDNVNNACYEERKSDTETDKNDENNHIIDNTANVEEHEDKSKELKQGSSDSPQEEVTEGAEEVDTVAATLSDDPFKFSRSRIRPGSFRFRRAFSQRTRMKPLLENVVSGSDDKDDKGDDDDDIEDLDALQFTAVASGASSMTATGRRSGTFHRRAFSLKRHFQSSSTTSSPLEPSSSFTEDNSNRSSQQNQQGKSGGNRAHQRYPYQLHRSQSLKTQLMSFFVNLHGNDKASPLTRTASVNKHSLASVELSSWASRGPTRRSGTLAPFSSLNPLGVTTRAEILQTISSAIIHLFQRKRLKENELGLLQEHVRFLMEAEAGGLIYEYYKDQLLRKGMVILRERMKNEQGLELLTMLGETWDYFFREILPNLQAILYPLTPVLPNDESIRSLSLLAFRNIVVLKVSIREALDNVNKHSYPPSIQQMLLILQGITDNVFLSENQFLLEKLVARVVCPYMGQRGVYEGGPEPVIKVKLKTLPLNIPLEPADKFDKVKCSRSDGSKRVPSSASEDSFNKSGPCQNGNGEGGLKLKTVMEHLHDNGRRHSVVS